MRIIQPNQYKAKKYSATIGFFDGVHIGHRHLIDELISVAESREEESLVITFSVHPRKILHTEFQPQLLTPLDEKLVLLEHTDVDACAVLDFTVDMANMSAYDFMKNVLRDQYQVETLLVGYDHRFGRNREDTFEDYCRYGEILGIEVVQAGCFSFDDSLHVSSSEIRRLLLRGEIKAANDLLGYIYSFRGKVVGGFKVGRKIGFPTANLTPSDRDKLIPATGVYAVRVKYEDTVYWGMLNIGSRPTLNNGDNISIEVHIIDFDKDIYDQILEIQFLDRIRPEKKFNDIAELINQLNIDKEEVLTYSKNLFK